MNSRSPIGIKYRRLEAPVLDALILEKRRAATRRHLSVREWRELDRWRAWAAKLAKEGII